MINSIGAKCVILHIAAVMSAVVLSCFITAENAAAQNGTSGTVELSGNVTDANDGYPLIGVSVMIEGTKTGAATDLDGNWTLEIPDSPCNITFSYVGYETIVKEYTGSNASSFSKVRMTTNAMELNDVVVTGVPMASGKIANIGYDRKNNSFWSVDCDYVPVSYPGTGDLFASVLTGGFLTGDSLPMAMGRAAYFVERCIKTTFSYSSDTRYGVMLEKELAALIDRQNVKDFYLL